MEWLALTMAAVALAIVVRRSAEIGRLQRQIELLKDRMRGPAGTPPTAAPQVEVAAAAEPEPAAGAEAAPGVQLPPPLPQRRPRPTAPPRAVAPTARAGLEARLGGSLPIWIGAIALALAGVFLVKYIAEHSLLGPGARVMLAVALGFALLGVAWRMRNSRPSIAQGLAAAGIADLSAATWAAAALYGFLSPPLAIVCQGVVTALAVGASLRFGPFVALLGFVGGFALPSLVGIGAVGSGTVFGYLLLLQCALVALARRPGFWWMFPLGVLATFVWVFAWRVLRPDGDVVISPFVLLIAASTLLAPRLPEVASNELRQAWRALPALATVGALIAMMLTLEHSGFDLVQWSWLGLLAIGALVLAAFSPDAAPLPWLAAIALGIRLLSIDDPLLDERVFVGTSATELSVLTSIYALLFTLGADIAARARRARSDLLGLLPPGVVLGAIAITQHADLPRAWPGLVIAGLLIATIFVGPRAAARRGALTAAPTRELALWIAAFLALAVGGSSGFAPGDRAFVLLAGAPLLAWLAHRRELPRLNFAAAIWTIWLVVLGIADTDDRWLQFHLVLANRPFLMIVGLSLAAAATTALVHRGRAVPEIASLHQTIAVLGLSATVLLSTAQVFRALDIDHDGFLVQGVIGIVWLALARLALRCQDRCSVPSEFRPAAILLALGLLDLIIVGQLVTQPLVMHQRVGALPLLNGVSVACGIGGLLAVGAVRQGAELGSRPLTRVVGVSAFVLGFAFVTLNLRQMFQGTYLDGGETGRGEWYAYSAAWLIYGGVLLAIGVVKDLAVLRHASLLTILFAILKVFFFDVGQLDGLWRVLSFFGLGVCLIALAWVYQRFVVARPEGGPS